MTKQMRRFEQDLMAKLKARIPALEIEGMEFEYLLPVLTNTFSAFLDEYRNTDWFKEIAQEHLANGNKSPDISMALGEEPRIWVWKMHRGLRKVRLNELEKGVISYEEPITTNSYRKNEAINTADYNATIQYILDLLTLTKEPVVEGRDLFIFVHTKPQLSGANPTPPLFLEDLLEAVDQSDAPVRVVFTGFVGTIPEMDASFTSRLEFPFPDEDSIREIVASACFGVSDLEIDYSDPKKIPQALIDNLAGLSWRQLNMVAREVAVRMDTPEVAFSYALQAKVDAVKAIAPFANLLPTPAFPPPLIGLENPKKLTMKLKKVFDNPVTGVSPRSMILLVGPPGTGKSDFVKWMSYTLGVPVLQVQAGGVFDSLVGNTDKNQNALHKMAKAIGKLIYSVDEVEKQMTSHGSNSDGGHGLRYLSGELTFRQDVFNQGLPIIIVDTANLDELSNLPPEHYARYSRVFYVGNPSNKVLAEIFKAHLKHATGEEPDYNFLDLAKILNEGFTTDVKGLDGKKVKGKREAVGRDVAQVISDAQLSAAVRGENLPTYNELEDVISTMRSNMIALDKDGFVLAELADGNREDPPSNPLPQRIKPKGGGMTSLTNPN
jgi:hypothetical protein